MMSKQNLVSIVLPVLNEPELPEIIKKITWALSETPISHEIIVITSDKSKQDQAVPPFDNVKIVKSFGDSLERAILLGFSVADGDKIVVLDADGSHPVSLLPEIIRQLDSCEMVVASRFTKTGHYHTTFYRYFTSYFFTKYAQLLGSNLADPMSGYFGIQAQLLTKARFKPFKWKTALEINNKLHPSTVELPYTFENRKVGASKSNWKVAIRLLYDIMAASI